MMTSGARSSAWLNAGGDKALVQRHLENWLLSHASGSDSDFVYRAWLEAKGDFSVVRFPVLQWLHDNCRSREAVYLTKCVVSQPDLPTTAIKDVLIWCASFPDDEDALWRLGYLRTHLFNDDLAEDIRATFEAVVNAHMLPNRIISASLASR